MSQLYLEDEEDDDEPIVFRKTKITPNQNQVNCELKKVSSRRHVGSSQRGNGSSQRRDGSSQRLNGSFQKHCWPSERRSPGTASHNGQNSTLQKRKVVQGSKAKNLATLSLLCSQQAEAFPNQAVNDIPSKFTWRIPNFSKLLNVTKPCSEAFTIGSHKWKLMVYPWGASLGIEKCYLSVYLVAVNTVDSPYAKFCLAVVDQINSNNTLRKDFEHKFTAKENYWGVQKFIELKDLKTPGEGYIVNDVCIVEVEFSVNSTRDSEEEFYPNVSGEETSEDGQSAEEMTDHPIEPSTQSSHNIHIAEYPNAGQLFEEGKQHEPDVWFDAEIFENVGGFTILKTQALLYKQIWLKYGHIATSKILRDSYSAQVTLVSGIMTSIIEMKQSLSDDKMSPEVIESFEFKIKMAEGVEFNVKWLREWFENVKRDVYAEQKIESALVGQDQCLMAAMKQLNETRDELTKKLSAIETTISTLLSERQMKKRKASRGLSFDSLF